MVFGTFALYLFAYKKKKNPDAIITILVTITIIVTSVVEIE